MKVLNVFYDLSVSPLTFDVIYILAAATAACETGEYDGFHFHVVMPEMEDGHYKWRMTSAKDRDLSDLEKRRRVLEILVPIGNSCRWCVGNTVHWNRKSIESVFVRPDDGVFPNGYTAWSPRNFISAQQLFSNITEDPKLLRQTLRTDTLYTTPQYFVTYDTRDTRVHASKNTNKDLIQNVLSLLPVYAVDVSRMPLAERIENMGRSQVHFAMAGGPNFIPFFMQNTRVLTWLFKGTDPGVSDQNRLALLGLKDYGQWPQADENSKFIWYDSEPKAEEMAKEIELCLTKN